MVPQWLEESAFGGEQLIKVTNDLYFRNPMAVKKVVVMMRK